MSNLDDLLMEEDDGHMVDDANGNATPTASRQAFSMVASAMGVGGHQARAGGAVGATVPAAAGVSLDTQRQQQHQQQQRRSKYVIQQLFALMRQRLPPEKYDQVRRAVQSSKDQGYQAILMEIKNIVGVDFFKSILQSIQMQMRNSGGAGSGSQHGGRTSMGVSPAAMAGGAATHGGRAVPPLPSAPVRSQVTPAYSRPTPSATTSSAAVPSASVNRSTGPGTAPATATTTASSAPATGQRVKMTVPQLAELLRHAAACRLPTGACQKAPMNMCDKIRAFLSHRQVCTRPKGQCEQCKNINNIIQYHALKQCNINTRGACPVAGCYEYKLLVQRHQQQQAQLQQQKLLQQKEQESGEGGDGPTSGGKKKPKPKTPKSKAQGAGQSESTPQTQKSGQKKSAPKRKAKPKKKSKNAEAEEAEEEEEDDDDNKERDIGGDDTDSDSTISSMKKALSKSKGKGAKAKSKTTATKKKKAKGKSGSLSPLNDEGKTLAEIAGKLKAKSKSSKVKKKTKGKEKEKEKDKDAGKKKGGKTAAATVGEETASASKKSKSKGKTLASMAITEKKKAGKGAKDTKKSTKKSVADADGDKAKKATPKGKSSKPSAKGGKSAKKDGTTPASKKKRKRKQEEGAEGEGDESAAEGSASAPSTPAPKSGDSSSSAGVSARQARQSAAAAAKAKQAQEYAKQLLRITHARGCLEREAEEEEKGGVASELPPKEDCEEHSCKETKELLMHMRQCKDNQCKVPRCKASKYVLRHYSQCKSKSDCVVCRNVVRMPPPPKLTGKRRPTPKKKSPKSQSHAKASPKPDGSKPQPPDSAGPPPSKKQKTESTKATATAKPASSSSSASSSSGSKPGRKPGSTASKQKEDLVPVSVADATAAGDILAHTGVTVKGEVKGAAEATAPSLSKKAREAALAAGREKEEWYRYNVFDAASLFRKLRTRADQLGVVLEKEDAASCEYLSRAVELESSSDGEDELREEVSNCEKNSGSLPMLSRSVRYTSAPEGEYLRTVLEQLVPIARHRSGGRIGQIWRQMQYPSSHKRMGKDGLRAGELKAGVKRPRDSSDTGTARSTVSDSTAEALNRRLSFGLKEATGRQEEKGQGQAIPATALENGAREGGSNKAGGGEPRSKENEGATASKSELIGGGTAGASSSIASAPGGRGEGSLQVMSTLNDMTDDRPRAGGDDLDKAQGGKNALPTSASSSLEQKRSGESVRLSSRSSEQPPSSCFNVLSRKSAFERFRDHIRHRNRLLQQSSETLRAQILAEVEAEEEAERERAKKRKKRKRALAGSDDEADGADGRKSEEGKSIEELVKYDLKIQLLEQRRAQRAAVKTAEAGKKQAGKGANASGPASSSASASASATAMTENGGPGVIGKSKGLQGAGVGSTGLLAPPSLASSRAGGALGSATSSESSGSLKDGRVEVQVDDVMFWLHRQQPSASFALLYRLQASLGELLRDKPLVSATKRPADNRSSNSK